MNKLSQQEQNIEGFYKHKDKGYYKIEIKNTWNGEEVFAFEVYSDGSGISKGFNTCYLYQFQEAIRKGVFTKIEKLPKLPLKDTKKITLDMNNYNKGELESIKKQYKLKSLEDVFKFLISKGIYQVREEND